MNTFDFGYNVMWKKLQIVHLHKVNKQVVFFKVFV